MAAAVRGGGGKVKRVALAAALSFRVPASCSAPFANRTCRFKRGLAREVQCTPCAPAGPSFGVHKKDGDYGIVATNALRTPRCPVVVAPLHRLAAVLRALPAAWPAWIAATQQQPAVLTVGRGTEWGKPSHAVHGKRELNGRGLKTAGRGAGKQRARQRPGSQLQRWHWALRQVERIHACLPACLPV